ncbi:hypothetical protein BJY52DRAFT_499328 [Lactarius psammicola]|nr:hypothetical protein BJY52DRAFT_499328 [Lactarius psammicola]
MELELPSAFRWGPHLRRLHSTGIGFPAPLKQLYSSRDVVDIQLHDIVGVSYLSPQALANALSGMTQLRSLSLHLDSFNPRQCRDNGTLTLSLERIVLPALTHLKFRGTGNFFDRFMVKIGPPLLGDIECAFGGRPFVVSKLFEFNDRIEMLKSHCRADILSSERAISISFTQPAASTRLDPRVSGGPLARRLSYIARICNRSAAFLSGVEDLRIKVTRLPSKQDGAERWMELIRSFGGTKWFYVVGDYSTNIVRTLQCSEVRNKTLLPALHTRCIRTSISADHD